MNQQEGQSLHQKYGDAVDERMVLRLMGLMRQAWPELNAKRADLKVVKPNGQLVWPKKQRRKSLARIKAARAKPRQKKVAPLPVNEINAAIYAFPGAYLGDELEERFEFMEHNARNWETTDPEGTQAVNWQRRGFIEAKYEVICETPLTDHVKRKQVADGRALINTRNRLKAYLERRGVDLDKIRCPEAALFALFSLVESTP